MAAQIPVIDIAPFRDGSDPDGVARAWDAAMRRFGFTTIIGHGLPEALLDEIYRQAHRFFDLPLDDKLAVSFSDLSSGQGYGPMLNETVGKAFDAKAKPDLCETLSFSATPGARPNLWPAAMPELRPTVEAYTAAANALAHDLMALSARALDLPSGYFDASHTAMQCDLRCVLYPDQDTPPDEHQLRYGPHTDFGGYTILRQDDAPGGLQVLVDGDWVDVKPRPGALVINAGDLIQRWTNDAWLSNVHRVINPPADLKTGAKRLSIVVFTGPNNEAVIEALPGTGAAHYPPITSGAHVAERIAQTYGNLAAQAT